MAFLPTLLALLVAGAAGAPVAAQLPRGRSREGGRGRDRPVRAALLAWRQARRDRAFAWLELSRAGRVARDKILAAGMSGRWGALLALTPGTADYRDGWQDTFRDRANWRRERNAAKRRRRAIRAAGGQA